jgi:DNA-binding response OmpR family regulator
MGGLELVELLNTYSHRPRILLVSGYDAEDFQTRGGLPPGVAFLGKPYAIPDLLHQVRTILKREL